MIAQVTALLFMLLFARAIGLQIRLQAVQAKALILCTLSGITEGLGSLFTFFALVRGSAALLSPIRRTSPLVTLRDSVAATLIVAGVFVLSQS